MEYEINFLVLQSRTENVDQIKESVISLIKEHNGSINDELVYKKRKLSYEIKHEKYGFFTVLRFNLENKPAILELKRELNLLQDVVRYIIVKADELPELNKEILSMESREQTTVKPEEIEKMIAKSESKPVKKEKVKKEEVKEEKKKTKKPEEEETRDKKTKASKESKEVDDKSSLEDLDKKLDEILNI